MIFYHTAYGDIKMTIAGYPLRAVGDTLFLEYRRYTFLWGVEDALLFRARRLGFLLLLLSQIARTLHHMQIAAHPRAYPEPPTGLGTDLPKGSDKLRGAHPWVPVRSPQTPGTGAVDDPDVVSGRFVRRRI
jgi:hypothetical protein